jgi:large subunit ribosomal protein L31e
MSNDNDKSIPSAEAKVENEAPIAEKGTEIVAQSEAKAPPKEKAAAKDEKKAAAKDAKAKKAKEKEEDDKVVEEKVMTINLRHAYLAYGRKAAPKAVRLVKKVTGKVFKTDEVKIADSLNEILWSRGKTKTERRVTVKIQKLESGTIRVLPAEA